MKRQKLFFKNTFKNLIKNQLQLIMVILLIFLSVFVFTSTNSTVNRLKNSNAQFSLKSNLHDAIVDLDNIGYKYTEDDAFREISNEEVRNEAIFSYLKNSLEKRGWSFDFDRVESRKITLNNEKTLKIIGLDTARSVDKFVVTEGMKLDTWKSYEKSLYDLTTRWVYLSESFAQSNNIKINDIVRFDEDSFGSSILVKDSKTKKVNIDDYKNQDINEWIKNSDYFNMNWFQVVGFGSSADFATPIIDNTSPLPNAKNEGLAYVNPKAFGWNKSYAVNIFNERVIKKLSEVIPDINNFKINYSSTELQSKETIKVVSKQDKETYYSIKFNNQETSVDDLSKILNSYLTDRVESKSVGLDSYFSSSLQNSNKIVYSINDKDYSMHWRTSMFGEILKYFSLVMYTTAAAIILIGIVILVIMLKNEIEKSFSQNGVLISLGYTPRSLIISNCLYPFFISLIGGILGYFIGLPFQVLVKNIFSNYFTIQFAGIDPSIVGLAALVFGLFFLLLSITLLTYWIILSKYSTLQMINYENISTTNKFKIKLKKFLTKSKKFDSRFKGAILSSSISKFVSIISVMLIASFLVTIGVVSPSILNNYLKSSYIDNKYDNKVEYYSPSYNIPTSFYKTYNPGSDSVLPTDDSEKLYNMYLNNTISADVYSPKEDVGTLTDLLYKNLNKKFLTNQDLKLEVPDGVDKNTAYTSVISGVWNDYSYFGLNNFIEKKQLFEFIKNSVSLKEHLDELEKLRLFYINYRKTIGLNYIKDMYYDKDSGVIRPNGEQTKKDLITEDDLNDDLHELKNANPDFTPILSKGKIQGDKDLELSFYNVLEKEGYSVVGKRVITIYNWIKAFFINNLQQGFLQGIYVSSPQQVRKIMNDSLSDDSKEFNVGFNVIPYNDKTDDLGVYLNAAINSTNFKIYGIEPSNKTQNLINESKKNLSSSFENLNDIVINETLAKQLNIKVGDNIAVDHIIESLNNSKGPIKLDSWDTTQMNAQNGSGYTNQQELYSRSLIDQKEKGWKNKSISEETNEFIYNTNLDPSQQSLIKPTVMSQKVSEGKVFKSNETINTTYKVVGISRQYGNPKAWIQNEQAKKIAKFDETKAVLFQIFLEEWRKPKNTPKEMEDFINNINKWKLTTNNEGNTLKNYQDKFKDFLESDIANLDKILKLFENEYPLFNYKTSQDTSFSDISKGLTSSQKFGDFSSYGLNGGETSNGSMNAYKTGTINDALKIDLAENIANRIAQNIKFVIYVIIAIALILCLIIIMLIVNLVIVKNQRIIAVMKVLGYKNRYLLKLFIGMYIPLVIITSIIGYGIGIAVCAAIISNLYQSSIVLPFFAFTWWYPILTLTIVGVIYTLSSTISWNILKRIRLLLAIQE